MRLARFAATLLDSRRFPRGSEALRSTPILLALLLFPAPARAETDPDPCAAAERCGPARAAAETAFIQGLVAFQADDRARAAACFERALACRPGHGSARYWLGVTLLFDGEPARAERHLARSLKAREPPRADRDQVLAYLDKARRKLTVDDPAPPRYLGPFLATGRRPGRWRGELGLDVGRDSNPNLLDETLVLPTFDEGTLVFGDESDRVTELSLRLETEPWHAFSGGWTLGLRLDAEQSLHGELDFLDFGQGHAVAHLARGADPQSFLAGPLGATRVPYGADRLSVLAQVGFAYARLDGATYLRAPEAALALGVRQRPWSVTRIELLYQDLDYAAGHFAGGFFAGRDPSGALWRVAVAQELALGARAGTLRLGAAAGERDAEAALARSLAELRAGWRARLGRRASLTLDAVHAWEDYDDPASNLFLESPGPEVPPRRDRTLRLDAVAVWSLYPDLRLVAALRFDRRDADTVVPPGLAGAGLDYRRLRSSVGFRWRFGGRG